MSVFKHLAVTAAVAAATVFGLAAPVSANAAVVQLGFLLDRSGSIGSTDWGTIVTGLGNAIRDVVPRDGTYQITVVSFASDATTVLAPTVLNDANVASIRTTIQGATFTGGGTALNLGFDRLGAELLAGGMGTSAVSASYVNLATDGAPNSQSSAIASRNALIAAGVDNISVEGIGVNASTALFLQNSICAPQSCTVLPTVNFPSQGFYIQIARAADFEAAIASKIRIVTGQDVPEPTSLALLGLGLAGVGFAARRRKALAA